MLFLISSWLILCAGFWKGGCDEPPVNKEGVGHKILYLRSKCGEALSIVKSILHISAYKVSPLHVNAPRHVISMCERDRTCRSVAMLSVPCMVISPCF